MKNAAEKLNENIMAGFIRDAVDRFYASESGSVSADVVGMIAGTVALGMATLSFVSASVEDVSTEISSVTEDFIVTEEFFSQPGNPGNNKANGNAGENPNNGNGWGNGQRGRSE